MLHDEQLQQSFNEMFSCQVPDEAMIQAACGVRSGGLGMRRVVDLALPAFIASREESKQAVAALTNDLLNGNVGELLMQCYEKEVADAIHRLKTSLRPGEATEVDVCLAEACLNRPVNGRQRITDNADYLVSPAGGIDAEESGTLQGEYVETLHDVRCAT